MKLNIQTEMEQEAELEKLQELKQQENPDHSVSDEYGVTVSQRQNEYQLKVQKGKKYFIWSLRPEEKEIQAESETTMSMVVSIIRMGFCIIVLLFVIAVAVWMASHHQVAGMMVSVVVGLIPLWLFAFFMVTDIVLPRRVAKTFIERIFRKDKESDSNK